MEEDGEDVGAISPEELQRQHQERIAALAQQEEETLAAKRASLDAQKKKRMSFLSDMDSFSQTFEAKASVDEAARREARERGAEVLTSEISKASGAYVPIAIPSIPSPAPTVPPIPSPTPTAIAAPVASVVSEAPPAASITLTSRQGANEFNALASSLFATGANAVGSGSSNNFDDEEVKSGDDRGDELRIASRIGTGLGKKKSATTTAVQETSSSTVPAPAPSPTPAPNSAPAFPPAAPANESAALYYEDDDDDDEAVTSSPDTLSNILTRTQRQALTPQQKATWKALQADLTTRRKDFHGAVTYAFDGIFSWQMYGSAEAMDETGKVYTEYLMRCQWGTTWENLQPWIAARRYREFFQLDSQLKKAYPQMAHAMPTLPEKDYFRFLEADVVEKRRSSLENYMSKIVTKLPTILRSDLMDEFLGIRERIATIRQKIGPDSLLNSEGTSSGVDGSSRQGASDNSNSGGYHDGRGSDHDYESQGFSGKYSLCYCHR